MNVIIIIVAVGHLPLFWADVMNSSWVGGHADGGLHERTPYWLNGCVPLAYQLGDPNLIGLVNKYVDYILSHQAEDGWLGPDDAKDGNMYWSKFPMLLALRQVLQVQYISLHCGVPLLSSISYF